MSFEGFPKDATKFLKELKKNNDRVWFNNNKQRYKESIELPVKLFLEEMAETLTDLSGVPLGGKIFRIYRDVRFSKDKTPYNTHIRIAFFTAEAAQGSCGIKPGFFFSLEHDKLILGAGSREFPKSALEAFREAVTDPKKGSAFKKTLNKTVDKDGFRLESPELKRVPSGFDAESPTADLLLHKSLTIWREEKHSDNIYTKKFPAHLVKTFRNTLPVFDWLYGL